MLFRIPKKSHGAVLVFAQEFAAGDDHSPTIIPQIAEWKSDSSPEYRLHSLEKLRTLAASDQLCAQTIQRTPEEADFVD